MRRLSSTYDRLRGVATITAKANAVAHWLGGTAYSTTGSSMTQTGGTATALRSEKVKMVSHPLDNMKAEAISSGLSPLT